MVESHEEKAELIKIYLTVLQKIYIKEYKKIRFTL